MAWALVATAGFQVLSGLQQAETIRMNGAITEQINEMNAKYAEQDAYNAEIFGESEIAAYQPMIDATVADQRLAFAAQDVDVSYGTAADIQSETKLTGFLNQLEMRNQARAKAMGHRREARNIRLNGMMGQSQNEMNARSAVTGGVLSAINTGVSGYSRSGSAKEPVSSPKQSSGNS